MTIDINNLSAYKEDNRIEAKKAKNSLPNSIWETYSAFANTDGGIILLGVAENDDKSLQVIGVTDSDKLVSDFWNIVNNRQKVSLNVLTNRMVEVHKIEGKSIVVIRVPKVDRRQRPVYIGLDPMKGTYRRDYEGDHICTSDDVAAMYRDASDRSIDLRVIKSMDLSVFDMDTVHRYRNRFRQFHRTHIWNEDDDDVFLRRIGAVAVHEEDMKFHPTAAGLLMFCREYDIVREFPDYFLDYQERLDRDVRWTHRWVSTSGDWSGNLYDFFFMVYPRLTACLPVPFIAKGKDRIDETMLHLALREVLLNMCAHSDHYGRQGIVIVKTENSVTLSNPGDIRIGLKAALNGGVSDPRNVTIMKMFSLVDIGERAGSGIPEFMHTWLTYMENSPIFSVTHNPDRTCLTIPYSHEALQRAGSKLIESIDNAANMASSEGNMASSKNNMASSKNNMASSKNNMASSKGNMASSVKHRISRKEMQTIILQNSKEWITIDELAALIGRNPKYLRNFIIPAMLSSAKMKMMYPDNPNHPKQRYKAKD